MRHYLNLRILWAVLTTFRTVGPFELNWETQQYKCWISQYITFTLLSALQAINLFWLFLILRIAKNYVLSNVRQDERSDNEEEEEDDVVSVQDKLHAGQVEHESVPLIMQNGQSKLPVTRRNADRENEPPQVLVNGHAVGTQSETTAAMPNGKKKHL
jgi:acyl-CoA-dependent ceramide synthase